MGFLDNSGDIILDAVLTDLGRNRLARGDGSFKIESFALADDEINYSLYRNSNHENGNLLFWLMRTVLRLLTHQPIPVFSKAIKA